MKINLTPLKTVHLHSLEILTTVTESFSHQHVKAHDKIVSLDAFNTLAFPSDMTKAPDARTRPCGSKNKSAELDYPDAHGATRQDMISAGLRKHFLPPDRRHLTCTGFFFFLTATPLSPISAQSVQPRRC